MAQTTSITTTFINELITEIGAIEFTDSGTLSSLSLIFGFDKSEQQAPNTDVFIYEDEPPIRSDRLDANVNLESFNFICRIRSLKIDGKEEQSDEDVRYLREKIIEKLEDNYNNAVWATYSGYLDNNTILTDQKTFNENYAIQKIRFTIKRRRTTSTC